MADETKKQIIDTIKIIEKSIADESVSQGEIFFLQTHKQEVLEYDKEHGTNILSQWADISEEEFNNGKLRDDNGHTEVTITFIVNNSFYKDYERELDDFIANLYNNDIVTDYPEITEKEVEVIEQ